MVGPKAMGFSLLNRGVGQREGERMEVKLESADYYNWINDPSRIFLPPIHISKLETPRRVEPVSLKKTFTTRKGALLLFSEDFAVREEDEKGKDEKAAESEPLKVEDFAKCVLSYGDRSSPELGGEHVYLKFVHHRRDKLRAVRPGFSAKRYIASWSKTADDNFVAKLTTAGAILDSTLYESNLFLPHLKHRVGTDLSHYPAPYRLMRDMLMSPGEVSGYTFLWQPHDSSREITTDENGVMYPSGRSPSLSQGSIKVMRQDTKGEMHEVEYSDLDENTKESVLTELLLKSAISHALQKTEEAMEKAMSGSRPNSIVQDLAEAFAIEAPPNTASPKSESPAKSPDKLDLRKDSIKIPAGHSPDAGMFVISSRRPSHESRTSRSDSPKSKKTSSSPTKGNESPTTVRSHRTTKSDSTKKSDSDRLGADSPGKKSISSKSSGLSVPRVVIKPHLDLGGIPKAEEPRAPSTHSRSGSTPSSRGSPSKPSKRQSPTLQPGQPGSSPTVAMKSPKVAMIGGPFGIAEEEEDMFMEAPKGPVFVKPSAGKKLTSTKSRGPAPTLARQASQSGGMGLVKFDMKEAVETMLSEPPKPDEGIIKQAQQAAKQETRQQEMVMEDMGTKARAPFARKIRGGALTSGGTVQGNVQDMKAQQGSLFPTLDEAPKSEYKPKLQKRSTATTFPPIEENQKVTRQPGILMEVAEPAPPTMTAGEARIKRLQSEADERERKTSHEEKSEGGHPTSLARGDSTLQSVTEDDVMSVKKPKRKRIERPSSTTVFEEATGRVKHFTSRISMDDSETDLVEARTRRQKLRKILREQSAFIPDHIRKLQERPVRTMSAGDARPRSAGGPGAKQDKPITLADLALPPGLDKVIQLMKEEEERNPNAFSNKRRALVNRQGVPQRSSSRADLLRRGMDGSLLMAPDGDVIKIGQTIQPAARETWKFDISDPSTWKHLTKEQLIEKLRKHAAEIAARVLKGGGGKDLAADARLAADIWTENYTERSKTFIEGLEKSETESSITESGQQTLQAQMLGQLLANFKNLEDIAEFKDVLLQTLGNIVSSLTGMNIVLPADAEISEELLRALANQDLDPEDIEVYVDPITGKTYVRLRKKGQKPTPMVERKLGDVVIPAGVDIDDELAAMLAMGQYNEDDIEFVFDEKTGRRVARLKQGAVKKKPKIGGVEIPDDAVLSDDIMKALASGDLCADDLELVWDEKLGRHVVRVKSAAKNKIRTIGGVIIPKDAVIDDALAAALALGEYDADDIEYVFDEKTGKMVVRLKEGAKKKPKNIGGIEIPADAELDEEVLALLKSGNINPDDLEVFFDEATGKTIVRLKKKAQARVLGDVEIPADVEIDAELAAMLAMGQYSADDIEFVIDEKTGKRVARLKKNAVKKPPTIGGVKLPDDAYIPEDILAALANSTLTADDLEVVWDEKLGRHVVRVKSGARRKKVRQLGDVFIPRDAVIDDALAAALALGEYSADDLEYIYDEKTGKTIVRLKAGAKKKPRKIGGVEIPADAEISAELLAALQSGDITADDMELVWDEATGKMVVRLKSSYKRRMEAEERRRLNLRPLSGEKERPHFVFGKKPDDELSSLYGPYDPSKKAVV